MIPILFEESATTFTTNGIGRLSDAISCSVKEERNGLYELEMEFPKTGLHYNDLGIRKIIVVKPSANASLQAFRIYKITKPINGRVKIYAQHISYDLAKNVAMPFEVATAATACNTALQGLKTNAVETCPFTFETDVTTISSYKQTAPASINQRLRGVEGSILDQFGGEYEWDNWTVKLHKERGEEKPITLRYGKNITDIEQEENIANTVTGVVPFWTNSDNTVTVSLPEKVVHSNMASRYSHNLTVPLDLSNEYENQPTEAQIRNNATTYVNQTGFGLPKISIKVSFVELADTEEYKDILPLQAVSLCDTITVQFEELGIDSTAEVVETDYDVLNERYNSVQIGSIKSTLAMTINDMNASTIATIEEESRKAYTDANNEARDIIDTQTAWLTAANGYVIARKDTDGSWKELIFADDKRPSEWHNILVINEAGIGFSSDGGEHFRQAWTLDGNFHADFITTGILKGASGENFWNLDTGEFRLASTAKLQITDATYTGVQQPTASNYPASSWTTDALKEQHVGDTYYDSQAKKCYRWTKKSGVVLTFDSRCVTESTYDYVEIYYLKDSKWYKSTKFTGGYEGSANNIAGKEVYIPTTEFYFYFHSDGSYTAWGYKVTVEYVTSNPTGTDYFTQVNSDPRPSVSWTSLSIDTSNMPESSHPYANSSDDGYKLQSTSASTYFWVEYAPTVTSYVQDEVGSVDIELDQESVFNALTNNGQTQGIYLQSGKLYLNAEYMGTGALRIGGSNYTAIPSITVYNSNNDVLFSASASGIAMNSGTIELKNSGNTVFMASSTGLVWNATNSSMTQDGTLTVNNGKFTTKGTYNNRERKVIVDSGKIEFYYSGERQASINSNGFGLTIYQEASGDDKDIMIRSVGRVEVETSKAFNVDAVGAIYLSNNNGGLMIESDGGGHFLLNGKGGMDIFSNGTVAINGNSRIELNAPEVDAGGITRTFEYKNEDGNNSWIKFKNGILVDWG